MAITIFVLTLLAFYHLIMESIILPMYKLNMRYKLVELRDELISFIALKPKAITDELYEFIYSSICVTHNYIDTFSFVEAILISRKINSDHELEAVVERRVEMITNIEVEEIVKIKKRLAKYTGQIFLINLASWMIYLLPIVLALIPLLFTVFLIFLISKSLNKIGDYCYMAYLRFVYSFIEVEAELAHERGAFKASKKVYKKQGYPIS